MPERKYYVKNKDILPEIIKYKETGIVSEELGGMILMICKNYSNKGSFYNYTWKEDMVMEAVGIILRYLHNFDPKKGDYPNPFAYFTTICHNSFINYIRKQNKHSRIKDICHKNYELIKEDEYLYSVKGINYQVLRSKT